MKNSKDLRGTSLDGLNTVKYDLVNIERNTLFIRFYVSYNQTLIINFNETITK